MTIMRGERCFLPMAFTFVKPYLIVSRITETSVELLREDASLGRVARERRRRAALQDPLNRRGRTFLPHYLVLTVGRDAKVTAYRTRKVHLKVARATEFARRAPRGSFFLSFSFSLSLSLCLSLSLSLSLFPRVSTARFN